MADPRPIGIFDSGVGGLTVARAVMEALPDENIVYIGDSARSPYGPRSADEIRVFAIEIANELVDRGVKLLVVACNSVEVAAIAEVTQAAGVPVVGVVDAGARAAVAATSSGLVGVIGTEATIASGAYPDAIRGLDPHAQVFGAACPAFVDIIEHGSVDDPYLPQAAAGYLAPLQAHGVDVLILGCTHYPLIAPLLQDIMGPDVVLVSSAEETARDVVAALDRDDLRREAVDASFTEYFCTGDPIRFSAVADRFLGHRAPVIQLVLGGVVR